MILFVLMNLIVCASAFLLVYRVFKFSNFVDSLLSLFIIYLAQIVSTELILGILGVLYTQNLVLLNLSIFLVIWLISRHKESSFSLTSIRESSAFFVSNKIILLGAGVILVFGLVKIFINLANPPFGWDDLNYHFTFPVEWLKHGNLDNPITISDDPSPSYYPINGSLFFLWLILPFKSVFLADLGQVPFFILAFLTTYGLSRKLCLDREFSFYAAILFFLIPNFFKQLQIAYVDVMIAALFLICLNYLFLLNKELSRKNILFYSMSLGLLFGTKTVALPYGILLFLPFIYLSLKKPYKPYLFLVAILTISALGGFAYIRNFLETKNPLYPLDFRLFGKTIFKGVMDTNAYKAHFKIEDYRLSKLLFHEGLGPQTLIFILPAIFLALPVTLIRRNKSLTFNLGYILILPVLIYLVYRYTIPLANTRYLYPLLGTGIILGLYTATLLNIPKRIINILAVICILASTAELAKRQELVISTILTCLSFIAARLLIKYFRQKQLTIKRALFIPILSILAIIFLILMEKDYVKNEYPRYIKTVKYSGFWPDAVRAWDWLNRNTQGNNIAYVGRPVPFPLYGTNFKNNVYYVSVNKIDPAKLHYFTNSHYHWDYDFLSLHKNLEAKGNYRADADYSAWLNNLIKRNTDFLFIYSLHQTRNIIFPLEDSWAKANTVKFAPVFTNETVHIYKISEATTYGTAAMRQVNVSCLAELTQH